MKCFTALVCTLSRRAVFFLVLLCVVSLQPRAPAAVLITEFLAHNDGLLQDEDLESPDWIEIYNGGGAPVNLGGWHLTDEPGNLTKWTFPATNLAAGARLVVFASGKNRAMAG